MTHFLDALVRPRSVAIVGASADVRRTAGKPAMYLKKHGFSGRVTLVNPRYTEIDGVPCAPGVADLPGGPDVGLVLLGAEAAIEAVRQLAELGAATAIVLAGGFAEIDAAGAERQQRLVAAAGGMRLLGPNTIGLVNVTDHTALSASGALELDSLAAGRVAIVSQSGGMLGALLSRGASRGLDFRVSSQPAKRPTSTYATRSSTCSRTMQPTSLGFISRASAVRLAFESWPRRRSARQAAGGVQDRSLGSGRPVRDLAHRRHRRTDRMHDALFHETSRCASRRSTDCWTQPLGLSSTGNCKVDV